MSRDPKLASFELKPWLEVNSSGKCDCVVGFCEMAHPIYTCLRNQKTRHIDDAISRFALRINECKIVYEIDAIDCLLGVRVKCEAFAKNYALTTNHRRHPVGCDVV